MRTAKRWRGLAVAAGVLAATICVAPDRAAADSDPMFRIVEVSTGLVVSGGSPGVWLDLEPWQNRPDQKWISRPTGVDSWSYQVSVAGGNCQTVYFWGEGQHVVSENCNYNGRFEFWGNIAPPGPWTGKVKIVNSDGTCVTLGAPNARGNTTLMTGNCNGPAALFRYDRIY
jgi:hypothetical protein